MHTYKALIITCMDPRLQGENLAKIAETAGLKSGEYEVLAYAGPSLWMTNPHQPADTSSFWWLLENVSLKVHHISSIVLVGHSSCGGFALKGAPKDFDNEKQIIVDSLKSAADVINQKHPDLETKLVFVKIGTESEQGLPEIFSEIV